ncbi:MAG: hypothetical protein GY835_11045 [bacterium]|nr:hypothetical protein [bacterium]
MNRMLIFVLLFLVSLAAQADTYTLNADGSGDFATIQDAINGAANYDIIELTPGTYVGGGNTNVDFSGKSVTVCSQDADNRAVINGYGASRAFIFETDEDYDAVLRDLKFNDCRALDGGAILIDNAQPRISGCDFEYCHAEGNGGAIRCISSLVQISDCTFSNCYAELRGGCIFTGESTYLSITDCMFEDSRAELRGGALYISYSPTELIDCGFHGCESIQGGAVAVNNIAVLFVRCTMYDNTGQGAAIWSCNELGQPTLQSCTLVANSTTHNFGAIYLNGGADCTLLNTIIAGNTGKAIAIAPDGGSVDLICCDLWGNSNGDWIDDLSVQLGFDGNICEDPQFCDPDDFVFTINCASPCFTDPDCNQIGAWGVGCGDTASTPSTWSRIKVLYY